MSNISIFAKRAFLNVNSSQEFKFEGIPPKRGHLLRVSSMIRADQIAEKIGAKLNPIEGYQDDMCIYVKPHLKKGDLNFTFEGKRSYIDIVDGWALIPLLEKHPEIGVIACSQQDQWKLKEILPNNVVLIPQHHCNFERIKRNSTEIKTVGIIGEENAFNWLPKELEEELGFRGIKLLKYSRFFQRQDIIDFYMQIDLQIVWRPYRMKLSNPLKIVNASSFGIPTIAYRESVFTEMGACVAQVEDLKGFLGELDVFIQNPSLYNLDSKYCIETSEKYHIDNIVKLYKQL